MTGQTEGHPAIRPSTLPVELLTDQQTPAVQPLSADYYMVKALGIGVALVVMLATLPLLTAITKPEHTRFG